MKEFEYEKRIMGTEAVISIVTDTKLKADQAYLRMVAVAELLENRFSRFIPGSELYMLNEKRDCAVSKEFFSALMLGKDLHTRSSGVFNPLVDISRFGYDKDISEVKGSEKKRAESSAYSTHMDDMTVDEHTLRVRLGEGQRIDMGGYMKGRAAELMALEAADCEGVIVNLGGDIFTCGIDEAGKNFEFTILNPLDPAAAVLFRGCNSGIATSGTYNRHWSLDGKKTHHILEATGLRNPDTDVLSATVVAPSGHEADAFATVAVVLGSKVAAQFLEKQGFQYYLITRDGVAHWSEGFPLVASSEPISI